ncbi:UNVERIFIED_CONTAM: hypothetical protein H355_013133 [Colinus virginianus]|nr:hypothetical protein H355_013133 [Colinus virginianus]
MCKPKRGVKRDESKLGFLREPASICCCIPATVGCSSVTVVPVMFYSDLVNECLFHYGFCVSSLKSDNRFPPSSIHRIGGKGLYKRDRAMSKTETKKGVTEHIAIAELRSLEHIASFLPFQLRGHDEEAVVDMGKISSTINTNFEKEELESHRAVYIGVHVPFGKQGRRRHRHRGHRHHRRKKEKETDREDGRESPSYDTPSQRVQFILGTEDDDEHIPHDLFTEMDELCFRDGEEYEWKETARWLKFEEDVEDGGDRWSKPYVATLSLHSLFELRSCILNGTVMLDMRANTLDEIADMVLDNMIASGQLDESIRENVREALLKRHHHQNEKKFSNRIPLVRSFADIGKKHSDPHLLERNGLLASPQSAPGNLDNGKSGDVKGTGTGGSRENSTVDFSKVFHDVAYKAKDRNDLLSGIDEFLDQVTVLPPGEWDPSIRIEPPKSVPSQEKRKIPKFPNGSTPTGETLKEEGHHAGPELERTGRDYGLSYLSLRTSIGLWTAFLCIVLVATDASSLVCYITRFTEEAFAALICIIFIYEALEKLFHLGEVYAFNMHNNLDRLTLYSCICSEPQNPSNETLKAWGKMNKSVETIVWSNLTVTECLEFHGVFQGSACGHHGPYIPDVLFWSVILFFTTFFLSSFLKQFKTKRYFPTKVRSTISDFAVFLTIVIMVLIDYLVGVPSPKLHVPEKFEPTHKDRGWFIDPLGGNPWWTLLVAAIPALLCTILIFMDQQITAVIINRKEHKLKKGCGYHLDLFMVGIMLGVCSIMGLPWFVAATVLSISHVNSLKVESECSAPGEQPKFLGIREQRVTGLMIFVLMGLSVFMTSVLKFIPMPVLYGVFLYMGVSSLKGIQVLALVFIRKLMDLCFTKRELSWLDDLMPESKKKKEDDKKKKEKAEAERMLQTEDNESVHLQYGEGNVLNFPVKTLKYSVDPSIVNISDEMAKTAQWKALSMSTENAKVTRANLSPEKPESVKINVEDSPVVKYVDAETSL